MPVRMNPSKTGKGSIYGRPFVGPTDHPAQIQVNIAALSVNEVDAQGFLKPGVPFTKAGILPGAAPAFVFGVTPEPIDVLHMYWGGPDWATALAAAGTIELVVMTIGEVNRKIIEDNLGRVLTANELAAFTAAGSHIVLLG